MPVLGFDLCRLPRGSEAAAVLLETLVLAAADLPALAAAHPGPAHGDLLRRAHAAGPPRPRSTTALRSVGDALNGGADAVAAALAASLIGDLAALDRLVRDEFLDWTWRPEPSGREQAPVASAAVEVVRAALAAHYAYEVLPAGLAAALLAPWHAAPRVLRVADLGPQEHRVRAVLARVTVLDGGRRAALRTDARGRAGTFAWSAAMHDASWAVHLADRLRPAAAAQLHAVQAFHAAGFTGDDGAFGVWNLVSGVVHSLVVADLLDDDAADVLQAEWIRLVGPV